MSGGSVTIDRVAGLVTLIGGGPKGDRGEQGITGTILGNVNWQGTWSDVITYSAGSGVTTPGHAYVSIQDANLNHAVTDTDWWVEIGANGLEYVTAPIEVDHADSSPVALGTAPANSIVEPIIRCTENESDCVLTVGDENDADSHCTDALMPIETTDAPVVGPLGKQYYATSAALQAAITTAGAAGKWLVQFRVTLVI